MCGGSESAEGQCDSSKATVFEFLKFFPHPFSKKNGVSGGAP